MVYEWKESCRLRLDAQSCGDHLEKLEEKKGVITPEIVLEDARKSSSPLHDGFEWDDSVAAERFRLDQARYILRQIVIVLEPATDGRPARTIRGFVNVEVEDGEKTLKVYTTINHAMSDRELRRQVIARAYKELHQWSERYQKLSEFSAVRKAIRSLKLPAKVRSFIEGTQATA